MKQHEIHIVMNAHKPDMLCFWNGVKTCHFNLRDKMNLNKGKSKG